VDGILFSNPAKKIPKPRQPYHEQKVLNIDQVKTFLQVCQGTRWEAVFCLAISSGMRVGELSGLRWSDIDWEQGRLQVVRQLQRIRQTHFLEPKTSQAGEHNPGAEMIKACA
jgi:integrase